MRRLFDVDRDFGITRYFEYDELTDTARITGVQNTSRIVDAATRARNSVTSLDRWGDGKVVAHVPMTIYAQWVAEGKERDSKFLRRWLNDPDNAKLRVFPGKV